MVGRRARRRRRTVVLATMLVLVIGGYFGIRAIWHAAQHHFTATGCDIGDYSLDTDQASVAAQMVGEVTQYKPHLPARAAVLVLAAGLQESKLRNLALGDGDRDSVGVLQQRPSQGWGGGDANRLNDVTEATREFLDALRTHKGWQKQSLADAIQSVQISADGTAYAQHEPEAQTLADAFRGRTPAAVSCSFDKPTLVATGTKVVTQLRAQTPVERASVKDKTITVPGAVGTQWQAVAWLVANADRLGIDSVAYTGKRWSRSDGWQSDKAASPDAAVATMATI